jgi:hypothetical protein
LMEQHYHYEHGEGEGEREHAANEKQNKS